MINLYHDTVPFKSFEYQGDNLEESTESTSLRGGPIWHNRLIYALGNQIILL